MTLRLRSRRLDCADGWKGSCASCSPPTAWCPTSSPLQRG